MYFIILQTLEHEIYINHVISFLPLLIRNNVSIHLNMNHLWFNKNMQ